MTKGFTPNWEIAYCLLVDGERTEVELLGSSKKDAYQRLADEWTLCYPGVELPKRSRCKLLELERTWQGYK